MASKQVRKITSITANELVKVDMADRDGDGKKIKDTYATNAALTSAVNSANSGIDANSAAIASLGTRMTTAEGGISANASAISTEASTRATAVSNEATARATADTALGGRIDSLETQLTTEIQTRSNDLSVVTAIAHGASKTYVIGLHKNGVALARNAIFNTADDELACCFTDSAATVNVFDDVLCPGSAVISSGASSPKEGHYLFSHVVFIPSGLTSQEISAIILEANKTVPAGEAVQAITVEIGDVLLIKETLVPDRWVADFNTNAKKVIFAKLETTKVDLADIESDIDALEAKDVSHDSSISSLNSTVTTLQTTVAGKQNALTFDSTPTANSNNPVTSGGIKAALDGMQSSLNIQSSVVGSVTIND